MASVIEQCQVAPPPCSATKLTLPLTYFDLQWLGLSCMRRILFYRLPAISKTSFSKTIIPCLKDSLSLALKHYTILAGNVACPLSNSSSYPELRYVSGDSISVIFSETDMDFNFLVGKHPRNAADFYPLVPKLADAVDAPGVQLAPLLAIQVTLFPDIGISIAFTNHHVAADGATIVSFIRAWALLNKFGGEEQFLADEFIPFYDRSVIKDPHGQGMSQWNEKKNYKLDMCDIVNPPHKKVRSTFIMGRGDIVKLKNSVLSRRPSLTHVTTFTVTCAYVWTCLIKSKAAIGEDTEEINPVEFFMCAADCRARLNPPLPPTYVGNLVIPLIVSTRHDDLIGKEGLTIAVELIGEVIQKRLKDEEWILSGNWLKELYTINMNRRLAVAGSPKHDLYAVDFGWGRPEKIEFISIDSGPGVSMSLSKSRNCDGDLEVGLSLPEYLMNAFAVEFTQGLSFL